VFVLYALVAGIVVGLLTGGRLERLDGLGLRWVPLALVGLAIQLILFVGPVGDAVGALGPAIYVVSTGAVLVFVLRNIRLTGLPIVAAGAALNLVAIVANGGVMPTTAAAMTAAGLDPTDGFSNSAIVASPVLAPLTDVLALPAGLPLANVFSVGDLLIGLGVAVAIAAAMRRPVPGRTSPG
jgi:Family of unknown function (DUF5317)